MPLQDFFRCSRALDRFRRLPIGLEMDGFCDWLQGQGYSWRGIRRRVGLISHFNQFLGLLDVEDCRGVDRSHAEAYLSKNRWRRQHNGRVFKDARRSVRSFVSYLTTQGRLLAPPKTSPPYGEFLEEYMDYLKQNRNLADRTIRTYSYYVIPFLGGLDGSSFLDSLCRISVTDIQTFFSKHTQGKATKTRGQIRAALRSFLSFCAMRRYTLFDLTETVPKVFTYALSSVPRCVSEQQVQKIFETIDRSTPVGRRDFAIIQLLWTYGLRASQVRSLRLQDIEWKRIRIRFRELKGGKQIIQSLTGEVGDALLDYLRHGRPQAPYTEVFLTAQAPIHPLPHPSNIYNIVVGRMRRAGVAGAPLGSHCYRHAFASRMLKHNQSLKAIADMMGHRSIASTFIYTKVDFEMLHEMPIDWPEV